MELIPHKGHKKSPPPPLPSRELSFLAGGGEMAELMLKFEWSSTPMGPIRKWPQSLKTAVNLMLNSQHPMWIGWGEEMTFLYNDAYVSVLSLAKHPWALGRRTCEVWRELWEVIGPLAEGVFREGKATFVNDMRLFMNRGDFLEETYYSFSYSPIQDEMGEVAGLFCPSAETSEKVLNARRLKTLSDLGAEIQAERDMGATCSQLARTLSKNLDCIPFSLLYLNERERNDFTLVESVGLPGGTRELEGRWPLQEVVDSLQSRIIELPRVASLPLGLANQPLREAVVLPLVAPGQSRPIGALVAGVNPTRRLDADYRTFYELVAAQISLALGNAQSFQRAKRQAEELTEIDRAKTQFFSNVSHEFRTPLTLMLGPLEDALSDGNLNPKDKERLSLVHRNGIRLLKLVNSLLDFSRIEAGRVQALFEPVDLARLTSELTSVFRSAFERAGLQYKVHTTDLDEPVYVDREMWEKIVLNLISNALKYTFHGEVTVILRREGDAVVLRVRDTGTGIPQSEQGNLFKRFHRIEGAKGRSHEGTGIGLALIQELVKIHGGTIGFESEEGKGTEFIVTLPFGHGHLPAEQVGRRRESSASESRASAFIEEAMGWLPRPLHPIEVADTRSATTQTSGAGKIFLVDDNADMRSYLDGLLSENWEVELFADGEEALKAARKEPPLLIVSDVMMPKLDGFGLMRGLRDDEATKDVPIILLSARAGEEAIIEGLQSGADDYLVKPFSAKELQARVRAQIDLSVARGKILEQRGQLEKSVDELARSNAELTQFAYVASHDLKEPLRVVRTHLQFIQRLMGEKLEAEPAEHMKYVMEASGRMYRLVDDLLEYARVGVSAETAVPVDCDEVVSEVKKTLASAISESNAQIRLKALPKVRAIRTQVAQLFQNLMGNAIKYRGQSPLVIEISGENRGSFVEFSIKDNGIGFHPQYATRVFELFQRLHRRTEYPGTGIGLSICKKIVEQHGGMIWVVPELGKGADFRFTLPLEI